MTKWSGCDLKTLIDSGNALADLRLRRDDVIYVPTGSERFVSVLGEVQHPGAIPLTSTSTLASVLAEAGGFAAPAGNKPHIQIVDPATGTSQNDLIQRSAQPSQSAGDYAQAGRDYFCAAESTFTGPRMLWSG